MFCWDGWEGKGEGKKHLLSNYTELGTLYITLFDAQAAFHDSYLHFTSDLEKLKNPQGG